MKFQYSFCFKSRKRNQELMRTSSIHSQVSHSGDAVLSHPLRETRQWCSPWTVLSGYCTDRGPSILEDPFRNCLTMLSSQVSLGKEVRKYILEQDRSRVKPHLKYWDTGHKECTSVVACMPRKSRTLGFILSPSFQAYTYVCIDMDIDMELLWPWFSISSVKWDLDY